MKRFRVLFYIPKFWDGKYVDGSIASWTRLWNLDAPKELLCSHEEIWTPDLEGIAGSLGVFNDVGIPKGDCWTSTMGAMGGKGRTGSGVRKAPANIILKNPERWFYTEFEVIDSAYYEMIAFMEDELKNNQGYDKVMILNFFLPLGIGAEDKFICSEFSNAATLKALNEFLYDIQQFPICRKLKTTMSPLRSAKTLWQCGCDFWNLDGSLRLEGK